VLNEIDGTLASYIVCQLMLVLIAVPVNNNSEQE